MGRCDDQAVSFGVDGFESDERSDILRSVAGTSSVPLLFAIPNLFFVVEDDVVCDLGVFLATVCDEQTVFFTMSGFVNRGVTGVPEGGGQFLESIDFLWMSLDESSVRANLLT